MYKEDIAIYDIKPKAREAVNKRKPKIEAYFENKDRKADISSVKMYLDEELVQCKMSKDKVKYIPQKKLTKGEHCVKVLISDKKDKVMEYVWSFIIGDKQEEYNYYFGNPHSHTSYSSGQGTPMEAFQYAKLNGLDFLVVTDHYKVFKDICKWKKSHLMVKEFNKKYKKNLALCGFELSLKGVGHLNVFNIEDLPKKKISNAEDLCSIMGNNVDIMLAINHPGNNIDNIKHKSNLSKYIKLIEVGNGNVSSKYNRYENGYYKLLDNGWQLGAINGQDNHRKDWGESDNLTVVVAKKLNEKNLFDALKNRRTYSTESRTLKLKFKVNGYWMGSVISSMGEEILQFEIDAVDKKIPIKDIQIISSGGEVVMHKDFYNINKASWNPKIKNNKRNKWFLVKIIHEDDRIAISSPIFLC